MELDLEATRWDESGLWGSKNINKVVSSTPTKMHWVCSKGIVIIIVIIVIIIIIIIIRMAHEHFYPFYQLLLR